MHNSVRRDSVPADMQKLRQGVRRLPRVRLHKGEALTMKAFIETILIFLSAFGVYVLYEWWRDKQQG